jgi:hypothetical protein
VNVSFNLLAERELNDASRYYEIESPGLGSAFVSEVERCSNARRGSLNVWSIRLKPFGLDPISRRRSEGRCVSATACQLTQSQGPAACVSSGAREYQTGKLQRCEQLLARGGRTSFEIGISEPSHRSRCLLPASRSKPSTDCGKCRSRSDRFSSLETPIAAVVSRSLSAACARLARRRVRDEGSSRAPGSCESQPAAKVFQSRKSRTPQVFARVGFGALLKPTAIREP